MSPTTSLDALPNRPRFVFNDGAAADFTLSRPSGAWTPESNAEGGSDRSATGLLATFEIRRDELLAVPIRFAEDEWASVHRMIVHGQKGGEITLYLDAVGAPAVSHTVEVWSPSMGDPVRPQRRGEWGDYELVVTFRKKSGAVWTDAWRGNG